MRDEYDRAIDILTDAMNAMARQGVSRQGMIPALVDFTVGTTLILGGEAGANAIVDRIKSRIQDWKDGKFPSPGKEEH